MNLIKTKAKSVARRYLPAGAYGRLARLYNRIRRFCSWTAQQNHRRLRRLHNAYQGRRCFIIGNGPSLAQTDLTNLADEVTIGCNGLFLIFDKMGYLPTFYAVEDYLVAEDRAASINAIRGTTKIFPEELNYCLKGDADTIFINFQYEQFEGFPAFSERLDKVGWWGGTVTYLNLQLAYYLGCRQVYLIGLDHNYDVPHDVDPRTDQEVVIVSQTADVNHFDGSYFGPGYRWHNPRVDRMERAYVAARRFAEQHGMKIYNATIGGKLEVFPRVNYDDLFARNKDRSTVPG
jgi:hypothetical protein